MKTAVKCIISFTVGAGLGTLLGYKIYEKQLQNMLEEWDDIEYEGEETEEINSDISEPEVPTEDVEIAITEPLPEKPNLAEYSAKIMEERYAPIATPPVKKKKGSPKKEDIYFISYDDFGEGDVDCEYYTIFVDDVIANDAGERVTNLKSVIGKKLFDEMMVSDYDSVFIRDEGRKVDYQIVRDPRTYYSIFEGSDETTVD